MQTDVETTSTLSRIETPSVSNDVTLDEMNALVDEKLTLPAFHNLAGFMAGFQFVKVTVERAGSRVHFINNDHYAFHADYIAERIIGCSRQELRKNIDEFNRSVYLAPSRKYYIGILT